MSELPTAQELLDELTDRQQLFVMHYCDLLNGTEAAARAGYDGTRNVLAVTAHDNLRNPKIRAAIDARLALTTMPPVEIISRIGQMATADIAEFYTFKERRYRGKVKRSAELDLVKLLESGKSHLVKSVTWTQFGPRIEMVDAQAALKLLGMHHRLFTEKVEHSGPNGGPIPIREVRVHKPHGTVDD